jgi:hypothetical protein
VTKEAVLKPGQTLRLGQVEIRLEAPGAPAPAAGGAAPAVAPIKKPLASTMVISKGVTMADLEQGPHGFEATKGVFTKKSNKSNLYFIIGGAVFFLVIVVIVLMILHKLG